jgi:hypothetical protein
MVRAQLRELHHRPVEQSVANLQRRVAVQREHVDLVAVLYPPGREGGQAFLGGAEPLAEGPPLPAGDDLGHVSAGPVVLRAKGSSCGSTGRRRARSSARIDVDRRRTFAERIWAGL